jgi:hypothetical protein
VKFPYFHHTSNFTALFLNPLQTNYLAVVQGPSPTGHGASGCCGIRGANRGNWRVDQFAQAGGAVVKILHNPPYTIQEVMHVGSEVDTLTRFMPEGFLQEAEQAAQTWHRQDHASELAKDLLPALGSDPGLAPRKLGKNANKA